MNFLLDTNVLSETRKSRPNPGVTEWFSSTPQERMRISVLTVGEIERGITRLRSRGDERQAEAFGDWLDSLLEAFGGRVAEVDLAVSREWGRLDGRRPTPTVDGLLAATAMVNRWTLVTRNVRDFASTEVRLLNPFC